jgi:hypothetical protein
MKRTEYREGEYGVRWQEVNRRDLVIMKEKFFPTLAKRDAFIGKLEQKDNFINVYATSDNPF